MHHRANLPLDMDLCHLLQAMQLESIEKQSTLASNKAEDTMTVDLNYLPDGGPGSSNSSLSTHHAAEEMFHWHGCGYLQALRSHIDNFSTTSGEYLEAIFTHREIFAAYPSAHQGCARGFSDLAQLLEKRPWRADRDSDEEAVNAFRHEAWMIGATFPVIKLAPKTKEDDRRAIVRPPHICVLPMM